MITQPTSQEWAWLAGIFEGEGSIAFHPRCKSVSLRIDMTDRDVMERVNAIFPSTGGIHHRPSGRLDRKDRYSWSVGRKVEVIRFLSGVFPWLGSRRSAKAIEALRRLEDVRGSESWGVRCSHGHPLSGANLYVHPRTGRRMCRRCGTEASARWYRAKQLKRIKERVEIIWSDSPGHATYTPAALLLPEASQTRQVGGR